jgi:hypothetical protein
MASVTQGIIDFALAPPIGVLNGHLDGNGPYTAGQHLLTTWLDGATSRAVADTFGVLVSFGATPPAKLGLVPGFDDGGSIALDEFDMRLVQVVVMHQLLIGTWIPTQVLDIFAVPAMIRWSEALPGRLGLYVSPTISIDLAFLRVA